MRETRPSNGHPDTEAGLLDLLPPDVADVPTRRDALPPSPRELAEAKRDWLLSRVAVMLIDAAKMLDPITRILVARALAVMALMGATGVTLYTIHLTSGYERVAMGVAFLGLSALLIRRGQQ